MKEMRVKDRKEIRRDLNISIVHVLPYLTSLILIEKKSSIKAKINFCFEAKQISDEEVKTLKEPEQFLFNFYNSSCSILNKLAHKQKCPLAAIEVYDRDLKLFIQAYSIPDNNYLQEINNNIIEYRTFFS